MNTACYLLITCLALSACSTSLLRIRGPKNDEDPQSWADDAAIDFVECNTVLASFKRQGTGVEVHTWGKFRQKMEDSLEPDLFRDIDKYMSTPVAHLPEDDWWIRRGILYLDGNVPWRCDLKRKTKIGEEFVYELRYWVHTSKDSFGEMDPVMIHVKYIDRRMLISDIRYAFHPGKKGGKSAKGISIREIVEYAFEEPVKKQ